MHASHAGRDTGLQHIFGHAAESESIPLTVIRRRAKRQLSRFDKLAREQLASLDVGIPPAIGLINCPECALTVDNRHPQLDILLKWIDGNTLLEKRFKEVEVLFEMVRAAEMPGRTFPATSCFHIGLTSAGPVAYFEDHVCPPAGSA
jgi:hypothetical protein